MSRDDPPGPADLPPDDAGRPSNPRPLPRASSARRSRIPAIQPPPPPSGATEPDEVLDLSHLGTADDDERLRAIQEVVAHAKRVEIEVARAKPIESVPVRPFVLAALALPLLVITAYSWGARSAWLFGVAPTSRSVAVREAHLRYAMYLTAERVEAMRDSTGVLPTTVSDAWPTITYRAAGDSGYVLRGADTVAGALTLTSSEDPRAFLGDAAVALREPPR